MTTASGNSTSSCWYASCPEFPAADAFPPLAADAATDVCIVGAGIAGLTTAWLLAREGRRVIVLDDGPIAGGESGRTTAHLVSALDDRYVELERLHGTDGARLAAASHAAAIDTIERIVAEENIDCGFMRLDGYLFVPPGDPVQILEDELAAAQRAGLAGVHFVDRAPMPGFDTGPCLCFPRQGQFHPLKYLAALAGCIERRGGRLYTNTRVAAVAGGLPATVSTVAGRTVTAGAVVVATNTPINDRVVIHTKQASYRSYVIGLRVPRGTVARALFWDTPDPYHYVRIAEAPSETGDLLIVGGEDHKTGQADDGEARFYRLEAWARERFPSATEVMYRWSGQIVEPVDSLAYIGRNPADADNVYVATGDSGTGMTHGTIAGLLLTDLIAGRANPWEKLYDPGRVSLRAAGDFARENINVVRQYSEWLGPGDADSVTQIHLGEGAVVRDGLHLVAVYRDADGELHRRDARCPHLGCVVGWNATERTWDCPCHGSRFDAQGRVINGPAATDLAAVAEKHAVKEAQ
jgi:glycine/D-amino acid oxidase-like deaminating enzyme/nitrite reductase/ring-hydroxylating ferredoxin subunit